MLVEPLYHALVHDITAVHTILIARSSAETFDKGIIFESSDIEEYIVCRSSDCNFQRLVIDSCAFREQIFAASVDAITMEIVRLKEFRPELGLVQFGRNILGMLALNGRIRFEDAVNDVGCKIIFQAVATIGLWFDVGKKCSRYA